MSWYLAVFGGFFLSLSRPLILARTVFLWIIGFGVEKENLTSSQIMSQTPCWEALPRSLSYTEEANITETSRYIQITTYLFRHVTRALFELITHQRPQLRRAQLLAKLYEHMLH